MASRIGIGAKYIVLEPTIPSSVPNGSVFLDSTNSDALTTKTTGGSTAPLNSADASLFIKSMIASGSIGLKKPVSKRSDGKIQQADSDAVGGQQICGTSLAAASDGDTINVLLVGANIAGALTGLAFTSGDEIYLSETGGYTNDPDSFTGGDDSIIKLGIADCAGGVASSVATDLIVFTEVVIRP